MIKTIRSKVESIAEKFNAKVNEGYSGRCMFGSKCFGVTCENYDTEEVIKAGKKRGLKNARMDSMGLRSIVYWPDYTYEPKA